jgi:import inner membrane translocase subunit TIM23
MAALRSAVRPLATAQYSIASTSRAASTSAPSQPAASTSTSTESKPATTRNGALPLSWPAYLALRHKRRVYSQVASVPTTIASLVASASYFGNLEADPTQTIFGVEPIFAYIGAT